MTIPKIKNIYSYVLKGFIWKLAKNAFLVIVLAIFIESTFGVSLWYRYVILSDNQERVQTSDLIEFKEDIYQSILQYRYDLDNLYKDDSEQSYDDPFSLDN